MAAPNTDSADDGSLVAVLRAYLRGFVRTNMDSMLPARVVSYDDATNRVTVHPLIMVGTTDGQKISRANISNIPVFRFGGGGFFMRFPIAHGDIGWIKASDRDISLMMQHASQGDSDIEDWPNTERMHSFSDAVFFPDTLRDWSIDGGNSNAVVLQSMDGSTCFAVHDGKITIKGDMEVDGKITATGDVKAGSISLQNHTHGFSYSWTDPAGSSTGTTDTPS